MSDESACPVDHATRAAWLEQQRAKGASTSHPFASSSSSSAGSSSTPLSPSRPRNNAEAVEALMRARAEAIVEPAASSSAPPRNASNGNAVASSSRLSKEREISSIPKWVDPTGNDSPENASSYPAPSSSGSFPASSEPLNWVYPSPAQFYAAMSRKNQSPREADMSIVVPIHNAVNERAWHQILEWEREWKGEQSWDKCGGPKLVNFKGKPKELTWRAWGRTLMGYQAPFDRHDWLVDRCGHRVRYIIDFYTGKAPTSSTNHGAARNPHPLAGVIPAEEQQKGPSLSFYLDVRPAPDNFEGVAMRARRLGKKWFGI